MEWAFVDDNVIVDLPTEITLTGGSPLRVKYEKPDGSTGYWDASVNPTNNTYAQVATSFDVAGTWKLQVYVELAGDVLHGLWNEVKVYNPLC